MSQIRYSVKQIKERDYFRFMSEEYELKIAAFENINEAHDFCDMLNENKNTEDRFEVLEISVYRYLKLGYKLEGNFFVARF